MRWPSGSASDSASRVAAARVANRRGSTINTRPDRVISAPMGVRAPIKAKGTRVVFPAPGGA